MPVSQPVHPHAAASSFAFDQYEGALDVQKICEYSDRVILALHGNVYLFGRLAALRLEVPQYLSESNEESFVAGIAGHLCEIVRECARRGDVDTLRRLIVRGLITQENIDACVEAATDVGDVTAAGFLLQEKRERLACPCSISESERALSGGLAKRLLRRMRK